jgi:predicted small lipoprotein YifL
MRRYLALLVAFGAAGCGQSPPPATSTAPPAQQYREYKTEGGVEFMGQKAKFQRTVREPVENKSP